MIAPCTYEDAPDASHSSTSATSVTEPERASGTAAFASRYICSSPPCAL